MSRDALKANYQFEQNFLGGKIQVGEQNLKASKYYDCGHKKQTSEKVETNEFASENIRRFREEEAQMRGKSTRDISGIIYLILGLVSIPTIIGPFFVWVAYKEYKNPSPTNLVGKKHRRINSDKDDYFNWYHPLR